MKNFVMSLALVILTLVGGTGCATSSRGTGKNTSMIQTTPLGADVYLDNQLVGKTPFMVGMSPRKNVLVRLEKAGYETIQFVSIPGVDGAGRITMVANNAGVIVPPALALFYGVDYLTKAYMAHRPEFNFALNKIEAPAPPAPPAPKVEPPPVVNRGPREPDVIVNFEDGRGSHHGRVREFVICTGCRNRYEITITSRDCGRCHSGIRRN